MKDYNLNRFLNAQEDVYNIALQEIKNGKKESHWMWFIFPQLEGLGFSDIAKYFGIKNLDEAKEYLNNPVLSNRLSEITECLLNLKEDNPFNIMGEIDGLKLHSSLTLFALASKQNSIYHKALNKFFGGELDVNTLNLLNKQSAIKDLD